MNKLLILALFVAVFSIMIGSSEAFCGGCGCNIFNCNCDWTPEQCRGCTNCKATVWDNPGKNNPSDTRETAHVVNKHWARKKRSLTVGEYMDFNAADLDGNGFMDRVEFFLAYERLVYPNEYLEAEFQSLDVNQDGFISRIEAGEDS